MSYLQHGSRPPTDHRHSWLVDVPSLEVAKERLVQRHLAAGIETSREAASRRVEDNDLPNGELVKTKLVEPDLVVVN